MLWDLHMKSGSRQPHGEGVPPAGQAGRHDPHQPARDALSRGRRRHRARPSDRAARAAVFAAPWASSSRPSSRNGRTATRNRAASATCWNQRQGGQGGPARPADALLDREITNMACAGRPSLSISGVFQPEEFAAFDAAERFLWAHALPPAPDRGPRAGPVDLRQPGRRCREAGLHRPLGTPRGVEHFDAGLFSAHATRVGELTRHLP